MGNRQGHDQDELDAIVTALEDLVARRSASTSPRHSGRLLGMLLVTRGYLVQSELEYALAWQERSGRRLGQVVVDLGLVREEEIVELLAEQHRIDVLDPAKIVIEPETGRRIAEADARRLDAVPICVRRRGIAVAVADPTRPNLVAELTQLLRGPVHLFLTTQRTVDELIDCAFHALPATAKPR